MKLNEQKARAFMLSVYFISMAALSYAQPKTGNIENRTFSATPAVTKGYYSIYNNTEKLNSTAGKLIFSNKIRNVGKSESNISTTPKKGYFAIGSNAEKKRAQMAKEGINFSDETQARVIQNNTFPVIKKGYYSIGNNAKKLKK